MIPDTYPYYVFIRLSIWALRTITPASALYCCVARGLGYYLPWPLGAVAAAEVLFYFCVSLPRQWLLDRSRPRAVQRNRRERQELFDRCWASIPDLASFLRFWFQGAPLDSICREDVKDYLAWGFLYKARAEACDDDELEAYVRQTEEALGTTFPAGRGLYRASQVSTDPLRLQHKPLLFYLCAVGVDDLITYATASWIGLKHYRLPLSEFFTVFPFRPHTLLAQYRSPSRHLSYWYRPHTSTTRRPVLFIHGIGAGMRTYTGFFRDFIQQDAAAAGDGQTGIIAVELMPISMRVTKGILPRTEMLAELLRILNHHGWDKFVVMGHSYGTIIATHLLQQLRNTDRIGPMILVDPVTVSIHWGGIPYNFLYRRPHKASEWQLHYFASTDMCVAHSITRRFDWSENVLWRDDIKGRTMTVALASDDIILDPFAVQKYLCDGAELNPRTCNARDIPPAGHVDASQGLDIVWYDGLNHSEMFESARAWLPLVAILHSYCKM